MRGILVDWLVEVQECFELYHETLYLGVKLLDHFLEKNSIQRDELQLVGATTLIISSKIEVIKFNTVKFVCQPEFPCLLIHTVCDNKFPIEERKSIIISGPKN